MKSAAFAHAVARDVPDALRLLAGEGARALAGGQSLGPMLNLRLVRPQLLVQLDRLPQLRGVEDAGAHVTIGACVTHAAIADGAVPDIGMGVLARAAEGIAYRAVRNRGTIGGSLCHADPAADWLTVLTALGAEVLATGEAGTRAIPLDRFVLGAFRNALAPAEIVVGVRIPRLSASAGWGYVKQCRKPGEFAHAMAAALIDAPRGIRRAVIGATGGAPIVLEGEQATFEGAVRALAVGVPERIESQMHQVTFARALAQAAAA